MLERGPGSVFVNSFEVVSDTAHCPHSGNQLATLSMAETAVSTSLVTQMRLGRPENILKWRSQLGCILGFNGRCLKVHGFCTTARSVRG